MRINWILHNWTKGGLRAHARVRIAARMCLCVFKAHLLSVLERKVLEQTPLRRQDDSRAALILQIVQLPLQKFHLKLKIRDV